MPLWLFLIKLYSPLHPRKSYSKPLSFTKICVLKNFFVMILLYYSYKCPVRRHQSLSADGHRPQESSRTAQTTAPCQRWSAARWPQAWATGLCLQPSPPESPLAREDVAPKHQPGSLPPASEGKYTTATRWLPRFQLSLQTAILAFVSWKGEDDLTNGC